MSGGVFWTIVFMAAVLALVSGCSPELCLVSIKPMGLS